mmetsp:Transcript_46146/g.120917  ORF Transcript_46146/g.120917 Transcript_46146/m.120917 type:complete len:120 (+) Transcript_46146:59-418(+)
MWQELASKEVAQSSLVNLLQLDMSVLTGQYAQLDNLTTVCTLLLGFSVALWGPSVFETIMNDASNFCILGSSSEEVIGVFFFISSTISVGLFFVIIVLTTFIKSVSTRHWKWAHRQRSR